MPRRSSPDESERSHYRLTLAELAAHDDVCTDVMIDNAYFKSRIRKNRNKHIPVRGVKEEEVPKILLHKVIVEKNLQAAQKALRALPGVKRYRQSLRTQMERDQFRRHFEKYVQMYMTDCPWEVSTTNRYTITTYEAAVTARKRIKQGETIKYLTGTLVPLTQDESDDLDVTQRNFSIVVSSRKKSSSIFLGPARFSNHDCDANGRLVTRGTDGMEVIAMKNIEVGDEITVSYGDDYFGTKNIECLCHTCEKAERNGWTSKEAFVIPRSGASTPVATTPEITSLSILRKRKRDSDNSSIASCGSSKKTKTLTSPSKLQHSWTPPADSDVESGSRIPSRVRRSSIGKGFSTADLGGSPPQLDGAAVVSEPISTEAGLFEALSTESANRSRKRVRPDEPTERVLGDAVSPDSLDTSQRSTTLSVEERGSSSQRSADSSNSSYDADDTIIVKIESVETRKLECDSSSTRNSNLGFNGEESMEAGSVTSALTDLSDSQSTSVPPVQAISTLTMTKVSKLRGSDEDSAILPSVEQTTSTTRLTVLPISDSIRVPGDYVLTRRLLAQPHDRWIFCRNGRCGAFFIQPNGYQTRRECPRCERHSMLYGFSWPKTDPDPRKLLERKKDKEQKSAYRRAGRSGKGTWVEGGGDEEERTMDHRTIHRFVYPEEERETTRRGLLVEAEKLRERGFDAVAAGFEFTSLGARFRGGGSESLVRETSQSATPEDGRRRSGRFVPQRVYVDV